jgi:hypothetical protein
MINCKFLKKFRTDLDLWLPFLFKNPAAVRFIIPWLNSLKHNATPLRDEVPWITFEAKKWLGNFLNKDMVVFEWGTGGSTIYISKRVKRLISVEHDPKWYKTVLKAIKDNGISNCKYVLKEPNPSNTKQNFQDPKNYLSSSSIYKGMSFKAYVKVIDSFPDETFDLVIVDGRARPSCILHSLNKIRVGGYLMLDNSEREEYYMGVDLLANWDRKDFFGPGPYARYSYFWSTIIWGKNEIARF